MASSVLQFPVLTANFALHQVLPAVLAANPLQGQHAVAQWKMFIACRFTGLQQVLTEELPAMLAAIRFKGNMRWRGDAAFSRPVRSLLALHGGAVLPLEFAGLRAGRATHGLRSETAAPIEVHSVGLTTKPHHCFTLAPQSRAAAVPLQTGIAPAMGHVGLLSRAPAHSSWQMVGLHHGS